MTNNADVRTVEMKKRILNRDQAIFFLCILGSAVCFLFDLAISWALGSILYVGVLVLAFRSSNKNLLTVFAVLSSVLTLGVVMTNYHQELNALEAYLNEVLVLLVIWITTIFLVSYRKQQEGNQYLAAIVDHSHDAIISKTTKGIIASWNAGAEAIYGYTAKEIVGKSAEILILPSNKDEEPNILNKVLAGEKLVDFETVRRTKNGERINIALTFSPIKNIAGEIIGISSVGRNIAEQVRHRRELAELNEQINIEKNKLEEVLGIEEGLHSLFRYDKLVDFVVEKTANILGVERCSLMLFDEKSQELCLKGHIGLREELAVNCRHKIGASLSGMVAQRGEPVLVLDIEKDLRFARSNRPSYQSKSFMSAPVKIGDRLLGLLNVAEKRNDQFTSLDLKILSMIVRQVGVALESSRIHREVTYLSITDPLTGCFNHRHFTRVLDSEIERAKRYGSPVSMLFIDVDKFKSYNDQFGHLEGDALLISLGQVINQHIRSTDVACRYAGDEFAVILPQTSHDEAKVVSAKIKEAVRGLILKESVTVSIGVATTCPSSMNRYDLFLRADTALYEEKSLARA